MRKKILSAVLAMAFGVAASLVLSTPAEARSAYGCWWPRVCFYYTVNDWYDHRPTAAYKDMYYQSLGPRSYNANYVYNSRNDDGAWLHYVNEYDERHWYCLRPNQYINSLLELGTVIGIDISDDPYCSWNG